MADTEQTRLLREILATLKRMEHLQLMVAEADGVEPENNCPQCGSSDVKDASVMGQELYMCGGCGASLTKEVVHG